MVFSMDVARAHMQISFGASWAGYWWACAAGDFVRCTHVLLQGGHFLVMYVDHLLALFPPWWLLYMPASV